jgi:chromosome segregation ATPase
VENQLDAVAQQKDILERKCKDLETNLAETKGYKSRVKDNLDDMTVKLTTAESENDNLKKNIDELRGQMDDLFMQQSSSNTSLISSRLSLAPSVYMKCDMTNMSLDGDDSLVSGQLSPTQSTGAGVLARSLGSPGENMGDVVVQELKAELSMEREEKQGLERQVEEQRVDLENRIRSSNLEIQAVSNQLTETEARVQTLEQAKEGLTAETSELRNKIAQETESRQATVLELNTCQSQLKEYQEEMQESCSTYERTLAEKERVHGEELSSARTEFETSVLSLQTEVRAREELVVETQNRIKDLEKEKNDMAEAQDKMKDEFSVCVRTQEEKAIQLESTRIVNMY